MLKGEKVCEELAPKFFAFFYLFLFYKKGGFWVRSCFKYKEGEKEEKNMGFISKRRKSILNMDVDKELASEIVEIFEEKLEELNVTLPGIISNEEDKNARIKSKTKKELIYEIEGFIYSNKNKLANKIA